MQATISISTLLLLLSATLTTALPLELAYRRHHALNPHTTPAVLPRAYPSASISPPPNNNNVARAPAPTPVPDTDLLLDVRSPPATYQRRSRPTRLPARAVVDDDDDDEEEVVVEPEEEEEEEDDEVLEKREVPQTTPVLDEEEEEGQENVYTSWPRRREVKMPERQLRRLAAREAAREAYVATLAGRLVSDGRGWRAGKREW